MCHSGEGRNPDLLNLLDTGLRRCDDLCLAVVVRYLVIQGPEVIQISNAEDAARHKIDEP